ncbi:MAG: HAD-IC family P-type ATPase, partial [Chitinophagales bacterium]|nr:HAD-IC family P-type ATPase [Chitinophagales bacterium]
GKPTVTNIRWIVPENEELRHILFSIEQASEHPLADAIVRFLQHTSIFLQDIAVENITGQGIKGEYDGRAYFIGNSALMRMANIHLPNEAQDWMDEQTAAAQTVVVFSDAKQVLALVSIADKLKSSAVPAVRYLKGKGIKVYMLTGDNEQAAAVVAKAVGADDFMANVLPSDKAAFTQKLQAAGEVVAMVGDGINDSHALAQADVSIAMGKGSDIAIEVAKMTILSADLQKIGQAIHLSDQTVITIRENLFWAFIYNIIGIPLAAGILYPVNGFLLDPMFAGAAMAFSSVSVVMNSLRLKWRKI